MIKSIYPKLKHLGKPVPGSWSHLNRNSWIIGSSNFSLSWILFR